MGAADGRHLDDLPVEQLDAVVLVQDAQLGQPVVGVHREGAREQANRHLHNMDSAKCASQFAGGARAEWPKILRSRASARSLRMTTPRGSDRKRKRASARVILSAAGAKD